MHQQPVGHQRPSRILRRATRAVSSLRSSLTMPGRSPARPAFGGSVGSMRSSSPERPDCTVMVGQAAVHDPVEGPMSHRRHSVEVRATVGSGKSPLMTQTPTTDEWGIDATWLDANDEEHEVAPATIERLREIIGRPPADLEDRAPIVARPGDALEIDEAEVSCEDGTTRRIDGELPDDFPLGYHRARTPDGRERRLIVSPGRCRLPDERAWGWAVRLYAARSRESWGVRDLRDLRSPRRIGAGQGAGLLLINPLHA